MLWNLQIKKPENSLPTQNSHQKLKHKINQTNINQSRKLNIEIKNNMDTRIPMVQPIYPTSIGEGSTEFHYIYTKSIFTRLYHRASSMFKLSLSLSFHIQVYHIKKTDVFLTSLSITIWFSNVFPTSFFQTSPFYRQVTDFHTNSPINQIAWVLLAILVE